MLGTNVCRKDLKCICQWSLCVCVSVCSHMHCIASCIMAIHVLRSSLLLANTSTISGFSVPAVIRNRPAGDTRQSLMKPLWFVLTKSQTESHSDWNPQKMWEKEGDWPRSSFATSLTMSLCKEMTVERWSWEQRLQIKPNPWVRSYVCAERQTYQWGKYIFLVFFLKKDQHICQEHGVDFCNTQKQRLQRAPVWINSRQVWSKDANVMNLWVFLQSFSAAALHRAAASSLWSGPL